RPTSSRTPTRCAAPRRSTAPPAMPWPSPPASPNANCARPSTTRSCSPTGWCPRTATSTERPWPTPWTPSPSSPPMSPRWPNLADDAGVDSGLMIAHYTQAAMVSEAKRGAAPASVDSIPSSAMQEDHVSMGWSAARKLRKVVDNLASVVGIELYAASRACDMRETTPAPVTGAVIAAIRETVPGPGPDRFLSPELAETIAKVKDGSLVAAAEAVAEFRHTVTSVAGTWQPAGGGPAVDDPEFTALG